MYTLYIWYMKDGVKDKRLTFSIDDVKQIAIAAALEGKSAKQFMQEAVVAAAIMATAKHSVKKARQ